MKMAQLEKRLKSLDEVMRDHIANSEKERHEFNKRLGGISESMGTLVEDMVAPCGFTLASQLFGDDPMVGQSVRSWKYHPSGSGECFEIDLLVTSHRHALLVESKRRIQNSDIKEWLEKISRFGEFFPEHAHCRVFPAVASVYYDPSIVQYLTRQRIYAIMMGKETMEFANLADLTAC